MHFKRELLLCAYSASACESITKGRFRSGLHHSFIDLLLVSALQATLKLWTSQSEVDLLDQEVELLDQEVGLLDQVVDLLDQEVGLLDQEVDLLDQVVDLLNQMVAHPGGCGTNLTRLFNTSGVGWCHPVRCNANLTSLQQAKA